jgi:hypothetical protein
MGEVGGAIEGIDEPAEFGGTLVAAALFGHYAVRGEVGAQAFDDQFLTGAIGFGDEVEIALEFEGDPAFEIVGQQRAGFARDFDGSFQVPHRLRLFHQVFDVVLEDEEVGFATARDADERLIVVLDNADDFLAIGQLHAYGFGMFDELFEIFGFFKRLFRRARGFSLRWRSDFS